MEDNKKTPAYQRAAVARYNEKHDRINIIFPKGTKKRMQDVNIKPSELALRALDELEKIEQEKQRELMNQIKTETTAEEDEFFPFT